MSDKFIERVSPWYQDDDLVRLRNAISAYFDRGVVKEYLTVGQSTLYTSHPFYVNGNGVVSGTMYVLGIATGANGVISQGTNQASIPIDIAITGTDATDHAIKLQIDSNDIITAQATGDGAGGIVETSKKAIIDGQLEGDILNNQMTALAMNQILGLMTDPRLLVAKWEDPGVGTCYDASGQGHNGTYEGSMTSGDRVREGLGWALDLNGSTNYVDFGDDDDFSFGDGSNDEAVTWFGVIEVVATALDQTLISKYDSTTGSNLREWVLQIDANEKMYLLLFDESTNVGCFRISDNPLGAGKHSYVITYDGAGGVTAADTIKMYVDGALVASTASNNGSYVAMENLVTNMWIGALEGSGGIASTFMTGDNALTGADGSEWSAFDAHRFHEVVKGLYNL